MFNREPITVSQPRAPHNLIHGPFDIQCSIFYVHSPSCSCMDNTERTRIRSLPAAHFLPLLELLPDLRRPPAPVPENRYRNPDGTPMLVPGNADEVDRFIALCYTLDIVLTNDWNAFVKAHPFDRTPALIDGFDRYQCCMALTALVRGDRFISGLVEDAWQDGSLARLVERLP